MRKKILFIVAVLFFVNGFANDNKVTGTKYSEISVTLKDGQIKSGKIKHPFDLNKKIEIVLESGAKEKIDNLLIKEVTIKHENGVNLSFQNVYYYNNTGTKLKEKPKLMMVMMKEVLTLYYDNGVSYTNMMSNGLMVSTNYNNYYAIREGEDGAKLISGYVNGQANPNVQFKLFASRYFADYPELSQKIQDKVYKYTDIVPVCIEYINWKKSKK